MKISVIMSILITVSGMLMYFVGFYLNNPINMCQGNFLLILGFTGLIIEGIKKNYILKDEVKE